MDQSLYKLQIISVIVALLMCIWPFTAAYSQLEPTSLSVGFTVSWLNLDLSALNQTLRPAGYAPLSGKILLIGGMCAACFVQNWHLGGGSLYGEEISSQGEKQARLSLELGGVFITYMIWHNKQTALSPGAFAGVGKATLELLDHEAATVEEALRRPTSILLKQDFFALQPYISLDVRITSWLSVRLSAGYLQTFGGKWHLGQHKLLALEGNLGGYMLQILIAFNPPLQQNSDP